MRTHEMDEDTPLESGQAKPWYQDEVLWNDFTEIMFSDRRGAMIEQTVRTSPLFDFPGGSAVLDLCCGPGLYMVPLAQRGHIVTGVDLSPGMVRDAKQACQRAGVDVEVLKGDMLDFSRPRAFDVVLSMYSSFGYFEDVADNAKVLDNIYHSLRPGGQVLIEVFGKEFLASRDLRQSRIVEGDGVMVCVRNTVYNDWARLRTHFTKVRGTSAVSTLIDSALYSAVELKHLVSTAGFINLECFGGFDARPYDLGSKTLLLRAERPRD